MPFNRPSPPPPPAATPEHLFGQLPRSGNGHSTLWVHQADILRTYHDSYRDKPDVAIELPTGTGKTLPGLLIADWNRRSRNERVAFACPTVQLVRQVMRTAARQSMPAVDLSGSWRQWATSDRLRFERAEAIAVVSYSSIFNSRPRVQRLGTVVFDDAHAGEQYVAGAYSLEIDRDQHPDAYEGARALLAPTLPAGVAERLRDDTTEPVAWNGVHIVLPAAHDGLADELEGRLSKSLERQADAWYKLTLLRGHFEACLIYVSWRRILIRPFIPPTFENPQFLDARQRIYLSATLGESGELERAFGRKAITRLPLPESAGTPRSGRRFIVFPTLARDASPTGLTRRLIEAADRAIILTPSAYGAAAAQDQVTPMGWSVFRREDVESGFDEFAATSNAVCVLANRYDGIDLPADACRSVALYGHPRATHLQEEFLATRARAEAAISERIRSRVIQGTGRCTRGPGDYALVIVADDDTASYLARPETRRTLDPALQAEVQFGFDNSEVTQDDLLENINHFLAQDKEWQQEAEPHIAQLQSSLSRQESEGARRLGRSVRDEVHTWELIWQGAWDEAAIAANDVAQELVGIDEVRAYRAFWLLMSAYCANTAARRGMGSSIEMASAQAKLALAAAQPQTWIREVLPLPGLPPEPIAVHDTAAANALSAKLLRGNFNQAANVALLQTTVDGLGATTPGTYEAALTSLGKFLGADAFKPTAPGNCDSAWCWGDSMWIAIEAKSDERADAPLSIDTVRQANAQLAMLSRERGDALVPTPFAASIIASPRQAIDSGAVVAAQAHVHLTALTEIQSLARETQELWAELRPLRAADPTNMPNLVLEALRRRNLLPSAVFQRLTQRPIALG